MVHRTVLRLGLMRIVAIVMRFSRPPRRVHGLREVGIRGMDIYTTADIG